MPWSIRALQAGKHVLSEKPLTRRPEEAQAAFDAADRAGRVLAEAFMWRHHPQARKLLELVRDRTVGNLRLIRASFSFDIFGMDRPDDVRLQAELDGGGLMDVGCYCVSGMRLLAGEPERVSGRQITRDGVDVRFTGTLGFPGGVLGVFDCGLDMMDQASLEVVGDAGSLFLADPWHSRRRGSTCGGRTARSSGSRCRPSTRTRASWRTSRRRCAASGRTRSGARTRSGRRGRSRRSTARRSSAPTRCRDVPRVPLSSVQAQCNTTCGRSGSARSSTPASSCSRATGARSC